MLRSFLSRLVVPKPPIATLFQSRFCASRRRYKHRTKLVADDATNPLAKPSVIDPSVLHVVSVPIGNVKDFSLRALEVLRQVDVIVCSNRLATKVFLEIIDVDPSGRLVQYRRVGGNRKLVELLQSGSSMALVVPSGTPVVGDEGSELVREMVASGIRVSAVPGPSSIIAALTMSGVSMGNGSFFFGGNVSSRGAERMRQISACRTANYPSVFFESPKRLMLTLADLAGALPRRRVAVVHEITKMHESVHSDTAEKLAAFYARGESQVLLNKGQIVLIIEGSEVDALTTSVPRSELREAVMQQLRHGSSLSGAVAIVAGAMNVPSAQVRDAVMDLKDSAAASVLSPSDAPNPASSPKPTSTDADGSKLAAKRARRLNRRMKLIKLIERRQERMRLLALMSQPQGDGAPERR